MSGMAIEVHPSVSPHLVVADGAAAIDFYVKAFDAVELGRLPGPDGRLMHAALQINGSTVMLNDDFPEHCGGVARAPSGPTPVTLHLNVPDVDAAIAKAAAAGATVTRSAQGMPFVSGFGEVVHTLLPSDPLVDGLPAGRSWMPTPGDTRPTAGGRITHLDHVAVCLQGGTLEKYADFYRDAFGFSRYSTEYVSVGDQAMDSIVVRSDSGSAIFTLVAPDPEKEPGQLDHFLERNGGEGVQHLAFLTGEIITAVQECRDRGIVFLDTPDSYYDVLGDRLGGLNQQIEELRDAKVLADRDEWGDLLQLFTRSPYPRNTLFFELIQRDGSRGFGSANIRALYEAVDRDRLAAG